MKQDKSILIVTEISNQFTNKKVFLKHSVFDSTF